MNRTCYYFEKLMSIPRKSGNESMIADYLCDFAKEKGLPYHRNDVHDVIIKKNNNSSKNIILQCHTDMVCVSDTNNSKDFNKEGIDWYIEGDFYKAKGTTLGADNGIGVAMILSLLQETGDLPNIEAIFTTQEETTMIGAERLEYEKINGKTLISLDGVEEGVLEVSSAGMCNISLVKKLNKIDRIADEKVYKLKIDNLLGGHSGDDIHKNRINAISLLFKVLKEISPIGVIGINGGSKDNVIASFASCEFVSLLDINELKVVVSKSSDISEENNNKPKISIEEIDEIKDAYDFKSVIKLINKFKQGVLTYNKNRFPITSQNIGVIDLNKERLEIQVSLRSSDIEEEIKKLNEIECLARENGFQYNLKVKKPFFPYKEDSKLRKILSNSYNKLYNKEVTIRHIHACMEGGIFSNNIKNLDICTISPNVYDIHTVKERVSISSINRVYEWLLFALKQF